MDAAKLFNGIAVIIDDEINNRHALIGNIIRQIEDKNIPFITYTELPSEDAILNFKSISFLLLDWRLVNNDLSANSRELGATLPGTLTQYEENQNIEFIKKVVETCFCPVFIFSNENRESIVAKLEEADLYSDQNPGHIFIRSKEELKGRTKLFRELTKWVKTNPSVYVLREWEVEYQNARKELFKEFQSISPFWPRVLWQNFGTDGVNKSSELGNVIMNNLQTRMIPFDFSSEILERKKRTAINKEELVQVLEGEKFLKKDKLRIDDIMPGDIFKLSSNYYINIRASCDCIPDRSNTSVTLDDVELYLLKGKKLTDNQARGKFNKNYGNFHEQDNQTFIHPLDGGKVIDIRFKNLEIKKWRDFKEHRIGRLLPPYITRIQQRYALYIQRQGLPRIPDAAI